MASTCSSATPSSTTTCPGTRSASSSASAAVTATARDATVTVINFLAKDNEAQRLTFDILSTKLDLFGKVLDTSDVVLQTPRSDASEELVSALGPRRIWDRARSAQEIEDELRRLRDTLEERRQELERVRGRPIGLIDEGPATRPPGAAPAPSPPRGERKHRRRIPFRRVRQKPLLLVKVCVTAPLNGVLPDEIPGVDVQRVEHRPREVSTPGELRVAGWREDHSVVSGETPVDAVQGRAGPDARPPDESTFLIGCRERRRRPTSGRRPAPAPIGAARQDETAACRLLRTAAAQPPGAARRRIARMPANRQPRRAGALELMSPGRASTARRTAGARGRARYAAAPSRTASWPGCSAATGRGERNAPQEPPRTTRRLTVPAHRPRRAVPAATCNSTGTIGLRPLLSH